MVVEKKWTEQQQNAIALQKEDLLVSAGAGSGKTAVLVERILRKISDPHLPIDLSSLLIVTFTRAAASEMRERISKAIYTRLSTEPNNEHLVKQMMQLPICDITTIDSFCMSIVKNNATILDIDSSFGIFENIEAEMIKDEVIDAVLEDMYASPSHEFLAFANSFSGLKSDDPLKNMVITSFSFLRSLPFYIDWLEEKIEDYKDAKGFNEWASIILSYAERKIEICQKNYEEILKNYPEDDKNKSAREILLAEKIQCAEIYRSIMEKNWDCTVSTLCQTSFPTLRMKIEDDEQKAFLKTLRDDAKEIIVKLKKDFFFLDKKTCQKDMTSLYPILCGYFEVIREFDSKLLEIKMQKNMVEFSDLEHLTLKLLSVKEKDGFQPSFYAKEIGLSYSEILIDEYQDTNALQEMIFSFLGKDCQHFYVGDLKQSIYKFRHANPYIFKEKKETFSDDMTKPQVKINLAKNFRSRAGILDSINQIFSDIMSADLGDLDYQNGESLLYAAPYGLWSNETNDKTEILLIDTTIDDTSPEMVDSPDDDVIAELTKAEKEALSIAKEIKKLMSQNFQVEKDGHLQKIEFRDIVILMRSPGPVSEEFARVLLAEGIPVYSDTGGQYFNATEVATMISILEIIDNPLNDIPLVATLRSAIFYFDDNELLTIKQTSQFANYYRNLCETALEDSPLGQKCSDFLNTLKSWQEKSTYLSVSELIWKIYEDTDFFAICAIMANAQKKIGNLRILYHKAKQYEDHNFRGLYHFIDFIKRVRLGGGDMSEAKIMAENQNVVRIMSIHKSKGLEFPVVFCAGLGKRFNERFKQEKILMHSNLGIGMDYMDQDVPYGYPNISKIAITLQSESEYLSEEMRLLYVAMTRAKEKLYLTATIKDCEKMFDKWQQATTQGPKQFLDYLLTNKHFIHWIMPTVLKTNHIVAYSQLLSQTDLFIVRLAKGRELLENTETVKGNSINSFSEDEMIIGENFSYQYPYKRATVIVNKLSVSELLNDDGVTKNMYDDKVLLKAPSFLEKGSIPTPAQIGTLNHLIMQKIDLHKTTLADINHCIDQLIFDHLMDPNFAPFIDKEEIAIFFESELGRRLCSADKVFREISFEIPKTIQKIYPDTNDVSNQTLLVQGIIDCFFYEGEDIILIDYKTNASHSDKETVKEKYNTQISVYAEAIKTITKKDPKEKFIYLFSSKDVIKYD